MNREDKRLIFASSIILLAIAIILALIGMWKELFVLALSIPITFLILWITWLIVEWALRPPSNKK